MRHATWVWLLRWCTMAACGLAFSGVAIAALSGSFLIAHSWLAKALGPTVAMASIFSVSVFVCERAWAKVDPRQHSYRGVTISSPIGFVSSFAGFLAINIIGLIVLPWAFAVALPQLVTINTTAMISTCKIGGRRNSGVYRECIRLGGYIGWLESGSQAAWLTSFPQPVRLVGSGTEDGFFVFSIERH